MTEKTRAERAHLKNALRARGYALSRIAKELGVTPTTVTAVVRGHTRSRRIEDRVAEILEKSPVEIWPYRDQDFEPHRLHKGTED